jgi:uncharacterized protein (DUF4415 family)
MTKDASFPHGEQNLMKDATTGKLSKAKGRVVKGTDWNRLCGMSAAEIRAGIEADPDAYPTTPDFWKAAKVVVPSRKAVVTMRLDADLLDWFRQQRGYQTRINAILRTYMKAHEVDPSRPSTGVKREARA